MGAHKPVVRGIFIKHGSSLKRASERQIEDLLANIHRLEVAHKNLVYANALSELTVLREQFKSLSLHKAKSQLQRCRKHFNLHSDKCGRSLARALKNKDSQSYIPEIKNKQGIKTNLPKSIAEAFRNYYEALL